MPEVKASEGEDSQSNLLPGKMKQNFFFKLKILLAETFYCPEMQTEPCEKAAGAELVLTR